MDPSLQEIQNVNSLSKHVPAAELLLVDRVANASMGTVLHVINEDDLKPLIISYSSTIRKSISLSQ